MTEFEPENYRLVPDLSILLLICIVTIVNKRFVTGSNEYLSNSYGSIEIGSEDSAIYL